jgi:hypothetical protein
MEKLKIGLVVGAMIFVAGIALQDIIILIVSVLFTCGVSFAIFAVGD